MPRGDQISRQWQILQILESRRMGVSVPELADELESNVRTIYRDMEALEQAGFPLFTDKNEGVERWFFVKGYKPNIPVPLTLTELMALSVAREHLKAFEGTIFSDALKNAFDKIRSMLKPETHVFLEELAKRFGVGLAGRKDYRKHRETIDIINHAVLNHYTVIMKYNSAKGETKERKVDPYHVWFMGGTIYIVGHCHDRKQLRLFVLDRIEKANLTEDHFDIPIDFSMDKFTKDRFRIMDDGEPSKVSIRFDSKIAYYIKERVWHPTQEIKEEKDGSVILAMNVEGFAEIKSWVMSFGNLAEVLSPAEFRADVAREFASGSKKYSK